jgi:hypothetical protein
MADNVPQMEILRVLMSDAKRLFDARERCSTIHHTDDVRAAGDEVECAVQKVIRGKVPATYHVGHGHIVDATLATSPQIDVIISDSSAPVLFTTENGSEYFPYESVHAIGEVKSTYKKGHIDEFVETIRNIKSTLTRPPTPPNYIGNGVTLGTNMSSSEPRPYRNPIFSFMLFVSGESFDLLNSGDVFKTTEVALLPNVICLLDRGIVVNAQTKTLTAMGQASLGPVNINPEFNAQLTTAPSRWCFVPFGDDMTRSGSNLGFLWLTLMSHLDASFLMRPNMLTYLDKLFAHGPGTCLT